jgi:hypothetical protein
MWKRKIPLLFISMVICLVLILSGCTPKIYQLSTSVTPSGGGTVSPSEGKFSKVTLVATPAQYYTFNGWAGSASGNTNPLTVTMNSDEQIVAQFTKVQYTVQVTSNIPNGGTVSPGSGTYDAGTTVTINATPANGYRFLNWGTDATGNSSSLNLLINGNKNITANFIQEYTLAVSADPSEGTVSAKGGIYDAGAAINLTATAIFPYVFSSWSGTDNDSTNPTTVTMNTNKSVTANFEKLIAGQPVENDGQLSRTVVATIPIALKAFEQVQGRIIVSSTQFPLRVYIQDPSGKTVQDFGLLYQSNFQFIAQTSQQGPLAGTYSIVIANTAGVDFMDIGYKLTYTVYHLQ